MKHVRTPQSPKGWSSKKYEEEIEIELKPLKKKPKYNKESYQEND